MQTTKVAIIGSGPAGFTAGIYTARAKLEPVILAGLKSGGQLMNTTEVENFSGFPDGVMGPDLRIGMRAQAEKFGAKIKDQFVTAVDFSSRPFKLWTNLPEGMDWDSYMRVSNEELKELAVKIKTVEPSIVAESVVIATGASPILLNVPGEQKFFAKGVSACAVCDAAFFKDKTTFVIGGGESAMEHATALTKFAKEVHIVHRRDSFRASKVMIERVLNNPKIIVHWNSTLEEILGSTVVEKIKINENGKSTEYETQGVFLAIGHRPMNSIFQDEVLLSDHGYIITSQSATKQGVEMATKALSEKGLVSFSSMTSVAGVFSAGDGVDVRYKQAITASGQGCMSALDAERWLEKNS